LLPLVDESGSTLFILLLAGYYILLSKYSDTADIVVGSPITGRSHADLEHIIGMFVNMLSLRAQPQGNKSFAQFLAEVKKNVLDAMENQDYQFDDLVSQLGLQGVIDKNPLFNAAFVMQNQVDNKLGKNNNPDSNEKNSLELDDLKYKVSKFDLLFSTFEIGGTINLVVEFSTRLFKKSTIETMTGHYIEILNQVVENTTATLDEIRLTHDFYVTASNTSEDYNEAFGF
jgi:non-ribosomal peptide synthetase component F